MSFLETTRSGAPARYELTNSQYPELGMYNEKSNDEEPAAAMTWMSRLLARSPKAINAKRNSLLSRGRQQESRSGRSSAELSITDVESQASTDASTLLEGEGEEQERKTSSRVSARVVSDAIIGLSDGLTVPFALTAGLSALGNTRVVIFAGLAELTAGAISMGLGGYLGAKSEE